MSTESAKGALADSEDTFLHVFTEEANIQISTEAA